MWASYTCCELNSWCLFAGDPLPELQREAECGFAFAEKARFGICMDGVTTRTRIGSDAPRLDAEIRLL